MKNTIKLYTQMSFELDCYENPVFLDFANISMSRSHLFSPNPDVHQFNSRKERDKTSISLLNSG